jgi:hypothetical protein
MADPKKEETPGSHLGEVIAILLALYFVMMIIAQIGNYLKDWKLGSYHTVWVRILFYFADKLWPMLMFFGVVISGFAIWGILYSYRKLVAIREKESEIYGSASVESSDEKIEIMKNQKWERVIEHINSTNSSDWKLAIIEADIMLDDLLRAAGYHGDSVGEMLKAVEKSDFTTIEAAWEAHKTRNQIAHQGGGFDITERDAKRVIALYESVFKEFQVI